MRFLFAAVMMLGTPLLNSQILLRVAPNQQSTETDRDKTAPPAGKRTLDEIMNLLKRSVNGKAVVHNQCQSQGHAVQVEEGTEITEVSGCKATFKTRKTSTSPDGRRILEFTMYVNLADLTTPPSVEPQAFPQCQATGGGVLRVASQAQPGKKIRTTRRAERLSLPTELRTRINLNRKSAEKISPYSLRMRPLPGKRRVPWITP